MPSSAPGSLDRQTYADLLAYMLQSNDIVAGDVELPPNPTQLGKMLIPAGGFSFMAFSPYVAKPAVDKPDPFARYTPVTEALLSESAGRRLARVAAHVRRARLQPAHADHAAQRRRSCASRGRGRCRRARTSPCRSSTTASLFTFAFGDKLQALDARTGDLLWQYSHSLAQGAAPNHKRGIALYGDNVYMGTSDAHVIARQREDRQARLGHEIARLHAPRERVGGTVDRSRSRDDRHDGHRRRRRARRPADRRPRRGHRRRRVARAHDRAARHAGRRQLERRAGREAQRRVGLEHRQLRSRARASRTSAPATPTTRARCCPQSTRRASRTPRSTPIRRSRSIPTAASSSGRSSTFRTISGISTRRSSAS